MQRVIVAASMRRHRRASTVVAASVVFAGGAALAQPKGPSAAPPLPPPTRFAPVIDDPMLAPPARAATELGSWAEARKLLAAGSTELRRADAGIARADGRARQARAALRPTARFSAEASIDLLHPDTAPNIPPGADYTPTSPLVTGAISVRSPLLDLAARRGRDAAEADQRVAALDRADAERQVAQRAARALIAVVAAERAAELNRVGLRQALERAALGKRTYELGAATELDVVRTDQDVALARAALIAGDEQLRRAREALGLALGVDGAVGVRPGLAGDGLLVEIGERCHPLKTGEERADVAAALAAVEAARARKAQAKAGYLPSIDFTSNLFAYTTDPAPGRFASWTVGLVLSVPIWEGGARAGAIAERAAAEADAVAVTDDVRRNAKVEASRARRGEDVAGSLVTAATDARSLAERIDAMTRRSFEIGRATSLELVQSAAALRQAELTLSLREFERLQAQVDTLLTESRCVP